LCTPNARQSPERGVQFTWNSKARRYCPDLARRLCCGESASLPDGCGRYIFPANASEQRARPDQICGHRRGVCTKWWWRCQCFARTRPFRVGKRVRSETGGRERIRSAHHIDAAGGQRRDATVTGGSGYPDADGCPGAIRTGALVGGDSRVVAERDADAAGRAG
jgi:hypothetical protein